MSQHQNHSENTIGVPAGINPMRKVYAGQWAGGKRHGRGTHFFKDGSRYDGFWAHDARQGFGRMEYVNGDVYEGEWKLGKRCGHGILLLSMLSMVGHTPQGGHRMWL